MSRSLICPALALSSTLALLAAGCGGLGEVDDNGIGDDAAACEPEQMDLTGDGLPDAFDTTCDGVADAIDTTGDGDPDAFDTDGDGEVDDFNGDGSPDPVPPGVDDGDLENENSDADGYCFDPEGGWFECDDGAPPGSGVPGGPQLGDPGLGGSPDDFNDDDDDNGGGGEICEEDLFNQDETVPPRILLVVDKSGSMDDDAVGYSGSKWEATRSSLSNVVTALEGSVEFGLMLYPDGGSSSNQCREGSVDVAISATSTEDIVDTFDDTSPGGGTPTASTLERAHQTLDGLSSDGGSRVVVLATDGGPNCNSNLDEDTCTCTSGNGTGCNNVLNCLDDVNTLSAAEDLSAAGYSVFVIGIPGSEDFTGMLDDLAIAGGTALSGATKFYEAGDSNDLATSLESIASRVASCRFDLQGPVSNVGSVTVTVGASTVPYDPSRLFGWDLVDSDTIELFGAACDDVVAQPVNVSVGYCYSAGELGG